MPPYLSFVSDLFVCIWSNPFIVNWLLEILSIKNVSQTPSTSGPFSQVISSFGNKWRTFKFYDFHRKYLVVPADKAANNVVVVWRFHYINTLKQELSGTKAYKETSEEEKSVVNGHCNHLALKLSVCVKERQNRLPTMYWLPKLHKRPYIDLLLIQVLVLQLNFLNY